MTLVSLAPVVRLPIVRFPEPRDLRLVVLGRDPLARRGLAALLLAEPGLDVLGTFDIAIQPPARTEVVVWDLAGVEELPGLWDLPVVALVEDRLQAEAALSAGARAVIPRQGDGPRIAAALAAAEAGLLVVDPFFGALLNREPMRAGEAPLSPREAEVLDLLAKGLSNKEVANILGMSPHTAKFHVQAIFEKLGAQTRTEAVVRALRQGLLRL